MSKAAPHRRRPTSHRAQRCLRGLAAAAVAAAGLAAVSGAAAADTVGTAPVEVVVAFAPGTGPAERTETLAATGLAGADTIAKLDAVVVVEQAPDLAATLAALRADPDVVYAEPEGYAHAALAPDDPGYLSDPWPYERTALPAAWDVTTGSPSVVVAVVDSGVDRLQPDLANITAGYDFVNGDTDPADDLGHGTMVAGTVAAQLDNGIGAAGVCPGCAIMPVKVLGADNRAAWSAVAQGIVWATDHGADVINMSLNGTTPSQLVADAVAYANAHGVIVVAAGGNAGSSTPSYPSSHPGVIGVAATDAQDALYAWSNRGQHLELAAPGCLSTTYRTSETPAYGGACGTSFASPMVAGTAGLLLAAHPEMTRPEVESALLSSADALPAVDVQHGRLDAAGALVPEADGGPAPPSSTAPPALTGTARVGETLTATPGGWTGTGPIAIAYAWSRCDAQGAACVSIPVGSAQSYVLAAADAGATVRVTVTASAAAGSSSASVTSAVVAPAAGSGDGNAGEGNTGGGSAPPPAAAPAPPADGGVGNAAPPPASPPPEIAPPPAPVRAAARTTARPVGATRVGRRMSARSLTRWSGLSAQRMRFQWQVCTVQGRPCSNLHGRTSLALTLTRGLAGKRVRVVITTRSGAPWRRVSPLSTRIWR